MGVDIYAEPMKVTETSIEVIFETKADSPAAQSVEHLPVSQQSPAASLNAQPRYAFDFRDIADEEHQQKAWPDGTMINGDGTDKSLTASLSHGGKERDSEELKDDPDKEAFRLVPPPPKDPDSPQRTNIAPRGKGSKPKAKEEPKEEADASTAKRQEITCGANGKTVTRSSQVQRRGQVVGQLTKDQANRLMQINQANLDMYISPDYVDNIRVFVHIDRTRDGAWTVVLLPHGLAVQTGDRVEFTVVHLDPFRPCHYIPPRVQRLMTGKTKGGISELFDIRRCGILCAALRRILLDHSARFERVANGRVDCRPREDRHRGVARAAHGRVYICHFNENSFADIVSVRFRTS
jgi:hypothetical protein